MATLVLRLWAKDVAVSLNMPGYSVKEEDGIPDLRQFALTAARLGK